MGLCPQAALADLMSGSCALQLEPLTQTDINAYMHAGATAGSEVSSGAAGCDSMCTVYMLNPSTCPGGVGHLCPLYTHQGHSLMKATQVPQMLLTVSAAAYAAQHAAADGTSAAALGVATGSPVGEPTLPSESLSKPGGFDNEKGSTPKRRYWGSERI
jgi:hypothetical protein